MPVYFAGGEPGAYRVVGASGFGSNPTIDTNGGRSRNISPTFCTRFGCGLNTTSTTSLRLACDFTSAISQFWNTAQVWCHYGNSGAALSDFIQWRDSAGVLRLVFQISSSTSGLSSATYNFYKVNSAGTRTLLCTTSSGIPDATLTKLDFDINYSTSGHVNIYIAGALVGSTGTVDVTTDGQTTISEMDLSSWLGDSFTYAVWSETLVRSETTLNLAGLVTFVPNGAGNTDQWNGSYSDVNQNDVNQSTPNYTASIGQLQEYATTGVTGTFVLASPSSVTIALQGEVGTSSTVGSLTSVLRYGGSDILGSAKVLPVGSFGNIQESFGAAESNVVSLTLTGVNAGIQVGFKS